MNKNKSKNISGEMAENHIVQMLINQGHKILERNYNIRYAEIDVIYIEKTTNELVFAEVKYRKNKDCGYPYEYVGFDKIKKIELAAEHFIANYNEKLPQYMRIDVFSVLGNFDNIEHFKNVESITLLTNK